ncbi:Pre-mRNA-splicing factor SPF27 [Pelagophyceae sp. CCMP2097]|nr:Pre-mRNA-splicing factor SPF27 [Pelagophyceae sp. CCMP2097]|mmetsp:Transcript_16207/g.54651  ORF Transcript_16207/g.54651 Transcript_16207/m.54651 type:complete len:246 (+) Transcript_16207:40-777(+)
MALVAADDDKTWAASSSAISRRLRQAVEDDWDADVAPSLRLNVDKIDALSYVEVDESSARFVNELVEAEMASMAKQGGIVDYLAHRPESKAHFGKLSDLAQAELARIDNGGELEPLSIDRYNVEPPAPSLADDAEAWRTALDNCRAQLEHQANRVVNLELAESFDEAAWKRHVEDLEKLKAQLVALVSTKRAEADATNLKRKAEQTALAPEIARHERQRAALVAKHFELEKANAQLCAQVAQFSA